jgi:hypothetical protein
MKLASIWAGRTALEQVVGQEQDRQRIVATIMAHLNTQEISRLIGRGDLDAIVNMVAKFASLRLPAETHVLHPSQVVGERRNQNLVLIGGNDANSLTNALAPRLGCRLASIINDKGHNVVRDSRHDVDYQGWSEGITGRDAFARFAAASTGRLGGRRRGARQCR